MLSPLQLKQYKENPTLALIRVANEARKEAKTTAEEAVQAELARFKGECSEMMMRMMKEMESRVKEVIEYHIGEDGMVEYKGDDGYTPKKGVDYFDGNDADEAYIIQEVLRNIKIPQPQDGYTPVAGVDYPNERQILNLLKYEVGKLPTYNEAVVIANVTAQVKADFPREKTAEEIVKDINALPITPDKQIDARHIKNLPVATRETRKQKVGGGMGNWEHQSFTIDTSTTSVSLSYSVAGSNTAILVRLDGVLQAHNVAYTVSGQTVTLLFTPPNNNMKLDITYVRG